MIKRLHQFVEDANSMSWGAFKDKHNHHVVVMLPPEDTSFEDTLFETLKFSSESEDSRPPINDDYRVGILTQRTGRPADKRPLTIGRARSNDIILQDIQVSQVHALFEKAADSTWTICDNGSTNGTYRNGGRLTSGVWSPLRTSDTLKIGPGLSAVFFGPADFYQFLRTAEARAAFL